MSERRLADLCTSIDYGYTASARTTPSGPRFLRITDIVNGPPQWDSVPFCDADERTSAKFRLDHGDVVIARTGATTGYSAFINEPPDAIFASYLVRLKIDPRVADSRFISYYLKGPQFWTYVRGVLGDKSAQPNASAATLTKAPIDAPSIDEQKAIAAVLGALDDKIGQNRQTIRALEALAQATFNAWFVDFEPIRAKAAGKATFPGVFPDVFAALPERLADSPLGQVPDGWGIASLPQLATFLNGLALQKYPARGDRSDLPVIKIAELRKGSSENADAANADVPGQYIISDGDLLFSWSGTLEAKRWFGGKGALNQHLFKVTPGRHPLWYVHHAILHHLPEFRAIASSKATTMGHIQRKHLDAALVVLPPEAVLRTIDEVIGPTYALIARLNVESRSLAMLRDYLLPKLLSGEVRARPRARAYGI